MKGFKRNMKNGCAFLEHHSGYNLENRVERRLNLGRLNKRAIAVIQVRSGDER